MHVESSITAITWLPMGALDRLPDLPFGIVVAHHDEPPPESLRDLGDLEQLRGADAFREANELRAWIEVQGREIVDYGVEGRSLVSQPWLELGAEQVAFPAVEFPVIRPQPEVGDGWVRFVQTVGGRLGLPAARPLPGKPYSEIGSALTWTTVQLTLNADGHAEGKLVAASPFPRHTVFDGDGRRVSERGAVEFDSWYGESVRETPWREGTPEVAAAVEARLEEELDRVVRASGTKLARARLEAGQVLVEQGQPGLDMFLLLDGLLDVEIDGETVAQVGAGALLGELAVLGDGKRQATLRAVRASRVAVLPAEAIEGSELAELVLDRRRTDT